MSTNDMIAEPSLWSQFTHWFQAELETAKTGLAAPLEKLDPLWSALRSAVVQHAEISAVLFLGALFVAGMLRNRARQQA